ncbi:hypothetical protein DZF91_28230 [Actinomadura logoneensis]|uniref:Uncharacterized protein n=1 Tax=Actinomadura logoneensis TaxID=2293572 RepID=A0A372JG71_9ACTN|nr:hypothetical protein [Actinomadura logoneensis]RFU38338.1 hypothetical protein DZF91_28230 [Actinomadura logoneensis]
MLNPLKAPAPLKAIFVAATALAAVVAVPVSADAASHAWRIALNVHPTSLSDMNTVTIASKKDGWAFGSGYRPNTKPAVVPFSYHWNGKTWKYVALPKGLDGNVWDASIVSPSNAWAVSSPGEGPGDGPNAVLHWNGKRWSVVKRDLPGHPGSVKAFSSKNVWVFGAGVAAPGSGTWHYDGRTWKPVKTGTFMPDGVSATSATNMWTYGRDAAPGKDFKTVGRFDGRRWTYTNVGVMVFGLLAVSPRSVWGLGCKYGAKNPNYLLHWNGKGWKKSAAPGTRCLSRLSLDGYGGLWAVSEDAKGNGVFVHRSKTGKWSTVRPPHPTGRPFLTMLAHVPGTGVTFATSITSVIGKSGGTTSSSGQLLKFS